MPAGWVPRFKRAAETEDGQHWWRPFLVSDTEGFVVLFEDWTVGGGNDGDGDTVAAWSLAAAIGGSVALAMLQRLLEHAARHAQAQAEIPTPCSCGGTTCSCSCGVVAATRYFDLKQALLQAFAYTLHLLVVLACVSFNVWILCGICAGVLLGELLGSCIKKRRTSRGGGGGGRYSSINQEQELAEVSTLQSMGTNDDETTQSS